MRTMSQLTQEVLQKEAKRFSEDNQTTQIPASLEDIMRLGSAKKESLSPSLADTVGRRLYELKSTHLKR